MKNLVRNKNDSSLIEADASWNYAQPSIVIQYNEKVAEDIKALIFDTIRQHGQIQLEKNAQIFSLSKISDPAGHFCLLTGGAKWFLRITRRKRKDPLLEDAALDFASENGLLAPRAEIKGLQISWGGHNYLLYVFPFIEGRHFNGSLEDLYKVSAALKKLHNIFESFPLSTNVKAGAEQTAKRLEKTINVLKTAIQTSDFSSCHELAGWSKKNYSWLKEMTEHFNPYLCRFQSAQVIHGDFHLGNIMFNEKDEAVITDFEEIPDSYFSPTFDLVYLIQRFAWYKEPSEADFKKRLEVIKSAYGAWNDDLKDMMSQVSWHLIALILDRCIRRESIVPIEECDKFVKLEKLSKKFLF